MWLRLGVTTSLAQDLRLVAFVVSFSAALAHWIRLLPKPFNRCTGAVYADLHVDCRGLDFSVHSLRTVGILLGERQRPCKGHK